MSRRTVMINVVLVVAVVVMFVLALNLGVSRGEFGGTDAEATTTIGQSDPDYAPWFEGFWTQPGGEVESGLFALQAALGAGLLGFVLGTYRERRRARPEAAAPGVADAPTGSPTAPSAS